MGEGAARRRLSSPVRALGQAHPDRKNAGSRARQKVTLVPRAAAFLTSAEPNARLVLIRCPATGSNAGEWRHAADVSPRGRAKSAARALLEASGRGAGGRQGIS